MDLSAGSIALLAGAGFVAGAINAVLRHPIIRSFEPGEYWRWCYVDEVLV